MSEIRTVFGQDVTVETIKADVVAIGDGYTVTVQVLLDEGDVLVAHTIARTPATFEEASDVMLPEAVAWTSAWIHEHASTEGQAA